LVLVDSLTPVKDQRHVIEVTQVGRTRSLTKAIEPEQEISSGYGNVQHVLHPLFEKWWSYGGICDDLFG